MYASCASILTNLRRKPRRRSSRARLVSQGLRCAKREPQARDGGVPHLRPGMSVLTAAAVHAPLRWRKLKAPPSNSETHAAMSSASAGAFRRAAPRSRAVLFKLRGLCPAGKTSGSWL